MARKLVKSDSGDIVNLDNALTIKLVKTANRSGELERFWSIYTSANWAPDSVSEQDNGENFKAVELWVKRNMLSGAPALRDEKGRFSKDGKTTVEATNQEDSHDV